jgi:hypothetical protein
VALGIGCAAVGIGFAVVVGSSVQHRQLLRLSLVIWPLITALPAFAVAFVANVVLARLYEGRDRTGRL